MWAERAREAPANLGPGSLSVRGPSLTIIACSLALALALALAGVSGKAVLLCKSAIYSFLSTLSLQLGPPASSLSFWPAFCRSQGLLGGTCAAQTSGQLCASAAGGRQSSWPLSFGLKCEACERVRVKKIEI